MRTTPDQETRDVMRVLRDRQRAGTAPGGHDDGLRVVLAIEGGGMRGTVTAGMALALHELGLVPAFDAVYGSSAGAISGAWLLSSRPEGLRGWTQPDYARSLIRWRALLRGRPVVDVRTLIEEVYQTEWPMDFGSVLSSAVEYHPLATDAATGASTDLRPLIGDPAELRLALRASASLPFLAGPPVRLRGRRFYDAGVAESIPFRTPMAQGATHVLLLRSRLSLAVAARAEGVPLPPVLGPPRSSRLLARTTLRRESPELREALLTRGARTADDVARIAELEDEGRALTIRPSASSPPVSRLTTDGALLAAAFEAGRAAAREVFRGSSPATGSAPGMSSRA
jgi:predicted patatin/cPLA2 family phospholipase